MQMPMDLTLADVPAPVRRSPDLSGVAWSFSRRGTFEQCSRRYFYQYYGSTKRGSLPESDLKQLRFLKKLSNRHERAGQLLHLGVAKFLRDSVAGGVVNPSGLVRWVSGIFQKDIAYSASDSQGTDAPPGQYPPVLLTEYYHGQPDAEELCVAASERMTAGFENFFSSSSCARFRDLAGYSDVLVEKRISIEDFPVKVSGQVDLAFRDHADVFVVDWKLGDASSAEDSLQLVSYALWACQHFDVEPDMVRLVKVHLASDTIVEARMDELAFKRGRARIMQDAERMAVMDRYGRAGTEDAFTPCAQPAVCSLCPFLRVCKEGRSCLVDRD